MSGNYSIYTGHIWTDYSDGKHILTLAPVPAGALQAAIPLWISLVGSTCWILIKRTWYHHRLRRNRTAAAQNLFEWQTNLFLQNSAGDLTALGEAVGFIKKWQRHHPRIWRRALPIALVSVIFWATWQVWGIVSFYVWQGQVPSVALITSPNCGYLVQNSTASDLLFRSVGISQTILAETWVSQCYGDTSTDSAACSLYPSQSLAFDTSEGVDCPFASPDFCISTNSTPHQMDSGHIDSHFDLGMNAPASDRVTYRKLTTCSPVHGGPFEATVNANETEEVSSWPPDTVLERFFFGPITDSEVEYTYEYDEWEPLDGIGYQIQSITYTPGFPADNLIEGWTPNITFFDQPTADLSLFFLTQNHMLYNAPTYDPVFSATKPYPDVIAGREEITWVPTYYVNILGCTDQHQICDPNRGDSDPTACTPLLAWTQLSEAMWTIGLTAKQLAAAERIVGNLVMTNTANSVNGRNAAALLAAQTVSELLQTRELPVDHWRREVENWFAVSLAKLQRNIIDFAGGPSDPTLLPYTTYPVDAELAQTCDSQFVALQAGFVNFNFDAIIGIAVAGVVLMALSISFESCFAWVLKRRGRDVELKDWVLNGPYQMQRLAYEGFAGGPWQDEDDDLPSTNQKLPPLRDVETALVLTTVAVPPAQPAAGQSGPAVASNAPQAPSQQPSNAAGRPTSTQQRPASRPSTHTSSPQPSPVQQHPPPPQRRPVSTSAPQSPQSLGGQ